MCCPPGCLSLSLSVQLIFVNGKPTEWNLISEMGTCRESAAACFSLTKVISAPDPAAAQEEEEEEEDKKGVAALIDTFDAAPDVEGGSKGLPKRKKKKKAAGDDAAFEMSDNPLHEGDEGDTENPLHEGNDDDDEL